MESNNKLYLTNEELNELVGGSLIEEDIQRTQSGNNTNTTHMCICWYYNPPSITNSNTALGCSCYCCPILA